MSTLVVEKVSEKKTFPNFTVYSVIGKVDGELDTVEMAVKPQNAPKIGETIEVTVEDTQWGKKAKKTPSNAFQGRSFGARPEDPERQRMIVRQNALGNAVTFQAELAKMKKDTSVFTTDNVLMVAEKFAKFSLGELKPTQKTEAEAPQEFPEEDFGPIDDEYLPENQ